jgi:hypothetical protein
MSEAWNNAKSHLDGLKGYPWAVKSAEIGKNGFQQGDFKISIYLDASGKTPERLGMLWPPKQLDKDTYDKLTQLASEKNYEVFGEGSNVSIKDKAGNLVAQLDSSSFMTTTAELFQEIGEKVYGMKAGAPANPNVKNLIYSSNP